MLVSHNGETNMRTKTITITPTVAAAMLEKNIGNRNLRKSKVAQYASDMASGRWILNGEAIKVAKSGRLLDGQHRLHACIESGQSFECLVVSDLDDASQLTMDQGVRRSASNQFKLLGIQYSNDKAAACRNLWHWAQGAPLGQPINRTPSAAELLDVLKCWPIMDDAVRVSDQLYRNTRFGVARSTYTTFITLSLSIDADACIEFAGQVQTGEMLQSGDPALTLRKQFMSWRGSGRTLSRAQQLAWLWLGFCDFRAGKSRKVYKRGWLVQDVPELAELRKFSE